MWNPKSVTRNLPRFVQRSAMRYFIFLFGACLVFSCTSSHKATGKTTVKDISEIRFVGEYILPNGIEFNNTTIGGLSGIDYDASRNLYYMISDDPSSKGPTRY